MTDGRDDESSTELSSSVSYSIVVPIYNDGALARDLCRELASTFRTYLGHDDLARDLAGKVKGLPEDLVENPEYLRSSFLKGSRHRAENRRKAGFNPRGAPLVRSEG